MRIVADDEDEEERDAAGVDPVERDRETLREHRCREQPRDPRERREVPRRDGERDRGRHGDCEPQQPDRQTTAVSRGGIFAPALISPALPAPGEKLPNPST